MNKKATFFLVFIVCTYAFGNPQDGTVVSGDVVFRESGSTLTIEASDRSIIDWQDFSIGQGEITEFLQHTSNAAVLNRVTSDTPSQIFGSLLANGHVYLMNPNGILVGASGVINTGGFLATTLDQGPSNFFENGELELSGGSDAAIVNLGNITATGDIFLVARKIDNQGVIKSINGMVGLAAGKDVLLKESGEERIFIRPVGEGEIDSTGTIEALNIEIKSRGNPYSMAINLDGQLTASKVSEVNGRVFFESDNGDIELGENMAIVANELTIDAGNGNISIDSNISSDNVNVVTATASGYIASTDVVNTTASTDVDNITASDVELTGTEGTIDASINNESNIDITAGGVSLIADISIGSIDDLGDTVTLTYTGDPSTNISAVPINQLDDSSGGLTLTVNNLGSTLLGYDSFDIGESETVNFVQPGETAFVLNRITSDTPSQIMGILTANGANVAVYFVNPSGVEIGNSEIEIGNGGDGNISITQAGSSNIQISGESRFGSSAGVSFGGSYLNTSNLIIQPIIFRPLTPQPTGGSLSSPLFFNVKSSKPVVQNLQSPVWENNAEGTLLAKFSTQAEEDGRSIINLDK